MRKFLNRLKNNRNAIISVSVIKSLLLLAALTICPANLLSQDKKQPNIVFIAIDDMNDWTGFLGGHPQASTPNMDKLANSGVNFTNAQCSAPGCSPSRNALLYGIEPFNSGLYPFYDGEETHVELRKKYTSLPQLLKQNGYNTYGAGKIHHGTRGNPAEWTDFLENDNDKKVFAPNEGIIFGNNSKNSFRPTINPYEEHHDHKVASYGLEVLEQKHDKPFFLAVGIVKPHLPFDAPKPFFDALPRKILAPELYTDDLADIPKEGNGFRRAAEYNNITKNNAWDDVRRAYLACISWADYNIGRVIDALEKSPYADNTVIVLWSDHGYHLGEKMTFKKFTLWEEATRVPFIIKDLRKKDAKGYNIDEPVSLINVYKTIADFTGIQTPDYVDGISLVPQITNSNAALKSPAITSWGRGNYAIRTKEWRYIRYFDGTEELYNHNTDKNEWYNVADKPENESKKAELRALLPKKGVPMVKENVSIWSIYGADKKIMAKEMTDEERAAKVKSQKEKKTNKKKGKNANSDDSDDSDD